MLTTLAAEFVNLRLMRLEIIEKFEDGQVFNRYFLPFTGISWQHCFKVLIWGIQVFSLENILQALHHLLAMLWHLLSKGTNLILAS